VLEAEACTERGALGALLRREGLYASQLAQWRRAYEAGALRGASRARAEARRPVGRAHCATGARARESHGACGARRAPRRRPKKVLAALGPDTPDARRTHRVALMETVTMHGARGHVEALCASLSVPRASDYRARRDVAHPPVRAPRPTPPRALTPDERQQVLDVLHAPRFVDLAPAQVYATLLDEGRYLCAERTMYRVLALQQEVRARRAQRRHPVYAAPELLATGPNQLWSWNITKLKGPTT